MPTPIVAPTPASRRARSGRERTPALALVAPGPESVVQVLDSKLRRPDVEPGTVSRTGLVNRLRSTEGVRLAVIAAPPGYGKTTLLAQWAARDPRPFAWVTLDEHDADLLVLLRHLAVACSRVAPLDDAVLRRVSASDSVWRDAAPALASAVAACERPFVLVIDGVEHLRRGDPAELVGALGDNLPAGSLLVTAGRTRPPLPLARLRASGELLELSADDLRLGRREGLLLLRGAGLRLPDEESAELLERGEGWAAGIYLAALGRADRNATGGDDRYVAEYLEEQLERIPATRRAFLRRTSVLARLTGPLCDAVVEGAGSAVKLQRLTRENLFVERVAGDGGWFRYHPALQELLLAELEREEPELVTALHARAAAWLETHGNHETALDHALTAGDVERARRMLAAVALPACHHGRLSAVQAWLERFAAQVAPEDFPGIAALRGWVHALLGHPAEAERWLATAEAGCAAGHGGPSSSAWTTLLRAAMCPSGPERAERELEGLLAGETPPGTWLPTALLLHAATSLLRGETAAGADRLDAAATAAEQLDAGDVRIVALAVRSLLAEGSGDAAEAERLALEARALAATGAFEESAASAIAHAAAARACLALGRWEEARQELVEAERQARFLTHALPWLALETRLALASAYIALRERDGAAAQLVELDAVLVERPGLAAVAELVAGLRRQVDELPKPRNGRAAGLTGAELRLLPLLATHLSFREIGERLYVSRNTIKTQAISIYRKLGVSSRSAAIVRASELGLVDGPAP